MRSPHVPGAFPASRHYESRERHYESCGLDVGIGGHLADIPWVDTGGWLPALPMGFLQRAHDGVLARARFLDAPASGSRVGAWKRTTFEYDGLRYIGSYAPLFVHQYSQAWFDFRDKRDQFANYFENSVIGTEVHRRFCLELARQFPDYSDDLWGITASDSEHGYVVWGGPPEIGPIDGTVVPSAAGGSLTFLPQATLRVLKNIKE